MTTTTTVTQAAATTYFDVHTDQRCGSAVSVARIMPWRYSCPQLKMPTIATM